MCTRQGIETESARREKESSAVCVCESEEKKEWVVCERHAGGVRKESQPKRVVQVVHDVEIVDCSQSHRSHLGNESQP